MVTNYKFWILVGVVLLLSINIEAVDLTNQVISLPNKRYVRHSERLSTLSSSPHNIGMPIKSKRVSSNEADIVLTYDESLPDSIRIALEASKKIWASQLQTRQPIYISIIFESLGDNLSMVSDVAYCETPNLKGCPCALASQIADFPYGSEDWPDGLIILNSDVNWNCRFAVDYLSDGNIPSMVLRGIARCLGFGSTVIQESPDVFYFNFGWPTYFDAMLFKDNISLSTLQEGSKEMKSFVQSGEVFAITQKDSYKMYAPDSFEQDVSLCYLDSEESLMSKNIGYNTISLSIDEATSDILKTIGWNNLDKGAIIQCLDISNDGIGSSYTSHTFSIDKNYSGISNYNWKFYLKGCNGDFQLISSANSETFTIRPIESANEYYININGDLEGKIECDYTLNGVKEKAQDFILSLELKPSINYIENLTLIPNGLYDFSLQFNVNYQGADFVSIEIEEEFDSTLRNYRTDEPYIAHVKTGNISTLYYSWVTIVASNKYGKVYKTLEFEPTYGYSLDRAYSAADKTSSSTVSLSPLATQSNLVRLYDLKGNVAFEGTAIELNENKIKSGIYVKYEFLKDETANISRIFVP